MSLPAVLLPNVAKEALLQRCDDITRELDEAKPISITQDDEEDADEDARVDAVYEARKTLLKDKAKEVLVITRRTFQEMTMSTKGFSELGALSRQSSLAGHVC